MPVVQCVQLPRTLDAVLAKDAAHDFYGFSCLPLTIRTVSKNATMCRTVKPPMGMARGVHGFVWDSVH